MKTPQKVLIVVLGLVLACGALFALPPVNQRAFYYLDQLRIRAFYAINPPEEEVFTPGEQDQVAQAVAATMAALSTPSITATQAAIEAGPTQAAPATATQAPPTATPTPLPAQASIADVPYVDQHYGQNNCAPANLAMALQFWGWQGKVNELTSAVKPYELDKNVMPYELVDYVVNQTDLSALERPGGTPELLKRMVVAGFPVIVERGVYLRDMSGKVSWMGHYQVVHGYDDAQGRYQVKDSFEDNGQNFTVSYEDLMVGWRSFNYTFVVVFPTDRQSQVMALLGAYADEASAARAAYELASAEIYATEGQAQFFAWYNRGSSLVKLQDYVSAAQAYDEAFTLYARLPAADRPWRVTWYQTGPYFAYYYAGRYQDVLNLTNQTISSASAPYLEENFYWRAKAKTALGDPKGAVEDLRKSLEYHPGFNPSLAELTAMGVAP
jgi:hypothetical protein